MQFQDKVVLVTGGGGGIGRATALAFAREGAKVLVADINDEGGTETVNLIQAAGGAAEFFSVDVSQSEAVKKMVNRAVTRFGGLDVAVNNAGIGGHHMQFFQDVDEDIYDRTMNINAKGVWLCMKHEVPVMLEQGGGSIVNLASVAGLVGLPGAAIYTASKHAVIGLTKAAATELARKHIRVNAVCPAYTTTQMVTELIEHRPDLTDKLLAFLPMRRFADPDEIAAGILWLASPQASFVTGTTLAIDGGTSAW